MSKKKQKITLSDKIADLIAPRALLDPEIDSDDETAAKTVDYDIEDDGDDFQAISQLSDIRKKNVKLLHDVDAKYRGKVSSRKDFESESDSDDEVEEEAAGSGDGEALDNVELKEFSMRLKPNLGAVADQDAQDLEDDKDESDDAINEFSMKLNGSASNGSAVDRDSDNESDIELNDDSDTSEKLEKWDDDYEGEDDSDDDDELDAEDDYESSEQGSDEEESDYGGDIVQKTETETLNTVSILPKKQSVDHLNKGGSVQNQLQIWEKMLEVRIHSQKMLMKSNSLPNYEKFHKLSEKNAAFSELAKTTETNVNDLLSNMRKLQTALLQQYPETKVFAVKRKRSSMSKETVDAKRNRIADELHEDYENFKEYQNSVITKWYDRTKVLTPGSVKSQQLHGNIDILRKIEGVLANKDDLVKKSQLHKGGYELFEQPAPTPVVKEHVPNDQIDATNGNGIEQATNQIYCTEIYDDTDFYHTQLRELIEYKTNISSNSNEMAKQFVELQKLRKKMKKTVDTRASKGRKIRYVVHNKLVSFMAPNESSQWTNESKTELYRSLFGAQV